jgi:hypothetical protein
VLGEEEERLIGALDELAGTADVGARIIRDNRQSLDDLLRRLGRCPPRRCASTRRWRTCCCGCRGTTSPCPAG